MAKQCGGMATHRMAPVKQRFSLLWQGNAANGTGKAQKGEAKA